MDPKTRFLDFQVVYRRGVYKQRTELTKVVAIACYHGLLCHIEAVSNTSIISTVTTTTVTATIKSVVVVMNKISIDTFTTSFSTAASINTKLNSADITYPYWCVYVIPTISVSILIATLSDTKEPQRQHRHKNPRFWF